MVSSIGVTFHCSRLLLLLLTHIMSALSNTQGFVGVLVEQGKAPNPGYEPCFGLVAPPSGPCQSQRFPMSTFFLSFTAATSLNQQPSQNRKAGTVLAIGCLMALSSRPPHHTCPRRLLALHSAPPRSGDGAHSAPPCPGDDPAVPVQ